jgi:transcriptional regulator with XRE-family HTH domain
MMDKSTLTREQGVLQTLLRQLRQEANLRQQDLAERIGEPQSFISKYESGERRLDIVELRQICSAIGISLTTFVRRFEDEMDRHNAP